MRIAAALVSFVLLSGLLTSAVASDYSPLYAYRHREAVASMDRNPIATAVIRGTDRMLTEEEPDEKASAILTDTSFCAGSLCLASACGELSLPRARLSWARVIAAGG